MISSTGNGKIRELVRIKKSPRERSERGVFLVEGIKMFREIPPDLCQEVYVSESFLRTQEGAAALSRLPETEAVPVSDSVFQHLSDTQSPQGVLAVVRQMQYEQKDLMASNVSRTKTPPVNASETKMPPVKASETKTPPDCDPERKTPLIVVLDSLQDPGNLGTIIRTAEAAGASGILLGKGCADIYNPKVTRSTMGSIFRVPFVYADDLQGAVINLKECGIRILAAHLEGSVGLYEESFEGPTAILIGNESRGLSDETAALADRAVRIPMSGSVESLNAAVAAAVCMFEAKRQRMFIT